MAKNEEKLVIYSPLLMEESLTCRKYTNPKRYLGSKAIEPGHFRLYSLEKKEMVLIAILHRCRMAQMETDLL